MSTAPAHTTAARSSRGFTILLIVTCVFTAISVFFTAMTQVDASAWRSYGALAILSYPFTAILLIITAIVAIVRRSRRTRV